MSRIPEHEIASTLATFIAARGDRIACDLGTLIVFDDGGALIASLDGQEYEIAITVRRRAA